MSEEKVKIEITLPKKLYEKLVEEGREAGFDDINSFIIYVLEQLIETSGGEEISEEEEEKIKERLRALGYID